MCYLYREHQVRAAEPVDATVPPSLERLRPRLIGAVAAALVAGFAVAAIVAPPSGSQPLTAKEPAAAAPMASKAVTVPMTAGVERSSLPVDDGVPSASDVAKAGLGHCEHGL